MKKITILLIPLIFIAIACEKNRAPQIASIESLTEIIVGGSEVILKVNTSDENGDALTYNWSANGGEIISTITSDSLVWKAPTSISEDSYTITAEVSDGELIVEDELLVSVEGGKFIDLRDDNIYEFVQIGEQAWMAENLAYLPSVSPSSDGSEENSYYYVYDYEGTSVDAAKQNSNYIKYGTLYNWTAAMNRESSSNLVPSGVQGICPDGWHIPSDAEWTLLTDHLINNGYGFEGNGNDIAKSLASTSGWTISHYAGNVGNDQTSNNDSGFNALPGSYFHYPVRFSSVGCDANFWSSTEYSWQGAYNRHLSCALDDVGKVPHNKGNGLSVRCVKDE